MNVMLSCLLFGFAIAGCAYFVDRIPFKAAVLIGCIMTLFMLGVLAILAAFGV